MESPVIKRSIVVAGRKTSISLEDDFWMAFREIATARDITLTELIGSIDSGRAGNLSSAIRLFVLNHYRAMDSTRATSRTSRVETQPSR